MDILFVAKKVISSLLMPFSIGIFLIISGLVFLFIFKRKIQKAKIFLVVGIVWIVLVSHSSFSNLLLEPLETSYPKLENISKNTKYIVLLGGDMENRGWEILKQYNRINGAKIIIQGYEGNSNIPEAIKTANVLKEIGIPSKDILVFTEPKDTREEAKNISKMVGKKPFIMVTSAYHMKRAMMIFENENLNPIPAPTNFLIKDTDNLLSLPNGYNLYKTEKAWHEYMGIFWTKVMFLIT